MPGNTFGKILCLSSFGESHGSAIGGVLDGYPPGIAIDAKLIKNDVSRRKGGRYSWQTGRNEVDSFEILSGVFMGKSTGTPIAFINKNADTIEKDYSELSLVFRPSHADYTYQKKYGMRDYRGGGRASGRETWVRVAGGAFAKMILVKYNINIRAFTSQIGKLVLSDYTKTPDLEYLIKSPVYCPSEEASNDMLKYLEEVKGKGDSAGGMVSCVIENVPAGLGEPVFDKLEADIAKAMMSINASKGFEIGQGFKSASFLGSEFNDPFYNMNGQIKTKTNNSGGVLGGISNGMDIYFNVAFKPVPSISLKQQTVNFDGENTSVEIKGRHDACIVPRAVVVVEAMAALVLADHLLRHKSLKV